MYHSFLIHSSADGHLGCFHVLAIINSEKLINLTEFAFEYLTEYYLKFKISSEDTNIKLQT